jgi:hypothetical protein
MDKELICRKRLIYNHLKSLKRFNEWEKTGIDKNKKYQRLSAVFALYDLIPEDARQREINVNGIIRMRKMLSCLK